MLGNQLAEDPKPAAFINAKLYLGSAKHARDLTLLQSLNITSILNMTPEIPCYFPSLFTYSRVPLNDSSIVTKEAKIERRRKILLAIQRVADVVTNPFGGSILVHCAAGIPA